MRKGIVQKLRVDLGGFEAWRPVGAIPDGVAFLMAWLMAFPAPVRATRPVFVLLVQIARVGTLHIPHQAR